MKQIKIMESKPNTYETFNLMMLLGHTLHEKNGFEYEVQVNWKEDKVVLFKVEK